MRGFDGPSDAGDAPRHQRGPQARRNKVERDGPKGPIPIRTTGRFYAGEDDVSDDELDFDNFATRAPDADADPDADVDANVDADGAGDVEGEGNDTVDDEGQAEGEGTTAGDDKAHE